MPDSRPHQIPIFGEPGMKVFMGKQDKRVVVRISVIFSDAIYYLWPTRTNKRCPSTLHKVVFPAS